MVVAYTVSLLLCTGGQKYEDAAGRVLPSELAKFLDTWKRPEELVQTSPHLPPVLLKGAAGVEAAPTKAGGQSLRHGSVSRMWPASIQVHHSILPTPEHT